ncbi:MAG: hypothetical protein AB7U30_00030 [Sulfuricellaceae bacterium]
MQAIEPTDPTINQVFPGYHPQWVMQSQKMTIGPENFRLLREWMLGMNTEECGAYLRVAPSTVRRWEAGTVPVPFTAFELLRLVYESVHFRLSGHDWAGWFIGENGRLVSPDIGGLDVSPQDVNAIPGLLREIGQLKAENAELAAKLAQAQEENTRLRGQYVSQGVVDEITDMQERLADLLGRLNTAKVYNFPQPKEAAA